MGLELGLGWIGIRVGARVRARVGFRTRDGVVRGVGVDEDSRSFTTLQTEHVVCHKRPPIRARRCALVNLLITVLRVTYIRVS